MLLAQMLWNLVVDFIYDLCHAVIFVEFIELQEYMLLL